MLASIYLTKEILMKLNNSNKIIAIKNNEKIGELYDIICNKIYNYSIRYCVGLYI